MTISRLDRVLYAAQEVASGTGVGMDKPAYWIAHHNYIVQALEALPVHERTEKERESLKWNRSELKHEMMRLYNV